MNKDINLAELRDRVAFHSKQSDNLDMNEFAQVFPEVSFHMRKSVEGATHIADWFCVTDYAILQLSAYSAKEGNIYLLMDKLVSYAG